MSHRTESREHGNQDAQLQRIELARMESDLAYFQARIELIGEPATTNENAQHKLFQMLCRTFQNHILRAKRELAKKK